MNGVGGVGWCCMVAAFKRWYICTRLTGMKNTRNEWHMLSVVQFCLHLTKLQQASQVLSMHWKFGPKISHVIAFASYSF